MNKIISLKSKFVIGHNGNSHVVYEEGQVVYQGNKILFVGHGYDGPVDEAHDFGLSIISPGFIDLDADIDSDHALIDVAFPKGEQDKDRFVLDRGKLTKDPYTPDDFYIRQKFSMAQLIKNGITTALPIEGELFHHFAQSKNEHEIMAKVGEELGLRLYVGPSFRSATQRSLQLDIDHEKEQQYFRDALDFFTQHDKGDTLIKPFINPCQLTFTRPEILLEAMDFARKHGAPMRLHACEGVHEWDYTQHHFGKTTIDWFEEIGLLCPNLSIPHCVTAKDSEIDKLAKYGVSVIHTPFAEANVGSALLSFGKYAAKGVNMTMGTDAQPDDMLRNLRFAWDLDRLCHRRRFFFRYPEQAPHYNLLDEEPYYTRTTAADFFDAATVNGAKALLRDDIGRLAPGTKADIIVVDLNDITVGPYEDPIRTLIMSCTGNHITHTIIDGKLLMKDKKLIGINEGQLLSDAQHIYERFLSNYDTYDLHGRSRNLFFPKTYPTIKNEIKQ